MEHNGRITGKVLEGIRNSSFIVENLTEQRPNCYYGLGYAHALDKEVIPIIEKGEPMSFDIKDYNSIIYEGLTELKTRLKNRIERSIGLLKK